MAYASKNYTIKGQSFRVLYNSVKQEVWLQHLPNHEVLGFLSASSLYIPAGQAGHEDMSTFTARLKTWLNTMLDRWFAAPVPAPVTPAPTPTAPLMDKQVDDLVTNLIVVGDKFV